MPGNRNGLIHPSSSQRITELPGLLELSVLFTKQRLCCCCCCCGLLFLSRHEIRTGDLKKFLCSDCVLDMFLGLCFCISLCAPIWVVFFLLFSHFGLTYWISPSFLPSSFKTLLSPPTEDSPPPWSFYSPAPSSSQPEYRVTPVGGLWTYRQ